MGFFNYNSSYYGGNYRIPYYALFPPVYYSTPVARTYGYSPFAYPPGTVTPSAAPKIAAVEYRNPFVEQPGDADEHLPRPTADKTAAAPPRRGCTTIRSSSKRRRRRPERSRGGWGDAGGPTMALQRAAHCRNQCQFWLPHPKPGCDAHPGVSMLASRAVVGRCACGALLVTAPWKIGLDAAGRIAIVLPPPRISSGARLRVRRGNISHRVVRASHRSKDSASLVGVSVHGKPREPCVPGSPGRPRKELSR